MMAYKAARPPSGRAAQSLYFHKDRSRGPPTQERRCPKSAFISCKLPLDEIGNLGNPYSNDKRKSADLHGFARVTLDRGELRFEGRDHTGKAWRLWMSSVGGVGWTEVWT